MTSAPTGMGTPQRACWLAVASNIWRPCADAMAWKKFTAAPERTLEATPPTIILLGSLDASTRLEAECRNIDFTSRQQVPCSPGNSSSANKSLPSARDRPVAQACHLLGCLPGTRRGICIQTCSPAAGAKYLRGVVLIYLVVLHLLLMLYI